MPTALGGFTLPTSTAIFDDLGVRWGVSYLCRPQMACAIWGGIYYAWMALIAATVQHWKEQRLDIEFPFSQGYWFAYISTTTVGLGDVFLEPEVIRGEDLVVFPLLFLVGFVYFAAFLAKFAELLLSGGYGSSSRRKLFQSLMDKFATTDLTEEAPPEASSLQQQQQREQRPAAE